MGGRSPAPTPPGMWQSRQSGSPGPGLGVLVPLPAGPCLTTQFRPLRALSRPLSCPHRPLVWAGDLLASPALALMLTPLSSWEPQRCQPWCYPGSSSRRPERGGRGAHGRRPVRSSPLFPGPSTHPHPSSDRPLVGTGSQPAQPCPCPRELTACRAADGQSALSLQFPTLRTRSNT